MRTLVMTAISAARRLLFNTPLGRSELVARVYRIVFNAAGADLNAPIAFRGASLYVDPADRTYVPGIVGGFYETRELDIFEALAEHAAVLFDVGANIGVYSIVGCRRSAGLRVFAFEPVAENRAILDRNLALNSLQDRVSVEPVAVSRQPGSAEMHLASSGTHSLDRGGGGPTRTVDTVSLDAFCTERGVRPDIIKIDVEGHEAAVIDGAATLLSVHSPTVLLEYVPSMHQDLPGLVERLALAFSSCFVVDPVGGGVSEIEPARLDRHRSANLILTSDARHVTTVRRLVAA